MTLYNKLKTRRGNIDNIARTQHYETFYFCYKEIKWALLGELYPVMPVGICVI